MVRASILINRSFSLNKQRSFNSKLFQQNEENHKQDDLFVNPENVHIDETKDNKIILTQIDMMLNPFLVTKYNSKGQKI